MKKETKKDIFFLFVVIAYSLQAIARDSSADYVIYISGIIVSAALLHIIKNRYLGALAGLAVIALMEFFDPYCKFLTVIPFLLICAHKSLTANASEAKKKEKDSTDSYSFFIVQACLFLSIGLVIYCLVSGTENQGYYFLPRSYLIFFWLVGMLIYSFLEERSGKKGKGMKKSGKSLSSGLQFLYFVSVIAFSATVFFSCAKRWGISFSHNVIYLPWFIFICSMVYNGDPYIEAMSSRIESFLVKISDSDKVKK